MARTGKRKTSMKADPAANAVAPKSILKSEKKALAVIALGGLITLGLGVTVVAYAYVNWRYERSLSLNDDASIFDVPSGSGLSSIANRLEGDGIIDSALIFKAMTRLRGGEGDFKAGEFLIQPNLSMEEVFEHLSEGRSIQYPVTAPEGLTSAQIVRSLDAIDTLIDDDPAIPAEGTLLPETYMTPRGMTHSEVLQRMALAQDQLIDELWPTRAADLPFETKEEAIILASIVEKETGVGMERGKVAGVFINRLRRNIRLQSDPTIIYGVSKGEPLFNARGERRRIRRSEIDGRTDWNTYQIDGLPVTPICNPGANAIRAVLNPEETDAIYFVADGTGGHAFATTLREHERNVARWRRIQRERGLR